MDAVSLLNKHADIARIMEHYDFDKMRPDGSMIRSCCAIHGGDNATSFVANLDSNLWFCHTECGGGDMYTLVQRMEDVSFPVAVQRVAEILRVDIDELEIIERTNAHIKEIQSFVTLMRERKRNTEIPDYHLEAEVKNVKAFRAFNESTLRKFGLGFVASIKLINKEGNAYELRNRLSMPIHQAHRIVGYSLRATTSADVPKWSHQPRSIKTSDILYNLQNYANQDVIVVVEGIFDVWAYDEIGVYAVCTYGAHLSDWQYKLLLKTGASTIILSYDGDKAGREATKKAIAMLKNKAHLQYVPFEEGEDPEKITREELQIRYAHKRSYHAFV